MFEKIRTIWNDKRILVMSVFAIFLLIINLFVYTADAATIDASYQNGTISYSGIETENGWYDDATGTKQNAISAAAVGDFVLADAAYEDGALDRITYINLRYTGDGDAIGYICQDLTLGSQGYTFTPYWYVNIDSTYTLVEATNSNTERKVDSVYEIWSNSYINASIGSWGSSVIDFVSLTSSYTHILYMSGCYTSTDDVEVFMPELGIYDPVDYSIYNLSVTWDAISSESLLVNQRWSLSNWLNAISNYGSPQMYIDFSIQQDFWSSQLVTPDDLYVWCRVQVGALTYQYSYEYSAGLPTVTDFVYGINYSTYDAYGLREYEVEDISARQEMTISLSDLMDDDAFYTGASYSSNGGVMPCTITLQPYWKDALGIAYYGDMVEWSIDLSDLCEYGSATITTSDVTPGLNDDETTGGFITDDTNTDDSTSTVIDISYSTDTGDGTFTDDADWNEAINDFKATDAYTAVVGIIKIFPIIWDVYPSVIKSMLIFWAIVVVAVGVWRMIVG